MKVDSKFKKRLRNASKEEMLGIFEELKMRNSRAMADPNRPRGGLEEMTMVHRNATKQIAQLLTIAKERGIRK